MHIAVIGGGAAGMCAARHITKPGSGMTCKVYEQTDKLGGTWVYTDKTGNDEYGLPIHSSMYKNLRTNLPKETMEFDGFPWEKRSSYLTPTEVLNYLHNYAENFKINDHVKFHHHVTRVSPVESRWEVTAYDLKNKKQTVEQFDSVIVCNGHYSVPAMPNIKGLDLFEGEVMHSHYYRTPEHMSGKTVLIFGAGPSGIDISWDLSNYASKIYFSHHVLDLRECNFPSNVQHVPDISEVKRNEVVFEDNSSCHVDLILICTGYKYSFPFLTPECGVVIEQDRYVKPFYKALIHAHKPTLCAVGLVFNTFVFQLFDVQVQCFLRTLLGIVKLPSTAEMLEDIDRSIQEKQADGFLVKNYHKLGPERVQPYFDSLCELGQIPYLPRVVFRIYKSVGEDRKKDLAGYRKVNYCIIDDVKYTRNDVLIE